MVVKIGFSCSTFEKVKKFWSEIEFLPNKEWRDKYVGYKFLKIAK